MNKVEPSTLAGSHKPFDIVTDKAGNVGILQEVNVNSCQPDPEGQISYAVNWIVGDGDKYAWYDHDELTSHGNFLIEIAKMSCGNFGNNEDYVGRLLNFKESQNVQR